MKGIYLYMTMCAAAIAFAACTNELEESTIPADNALVLTVGDYPTFGEGTNTRVGTFDPGKTAWEEGDRILVSVTSTNGTPQSQYATLTYENNTWTTNPTLTRPESAFTVEAWYAPAYSWSNNELSSTTPGTGEFLHIEQTGLSDRNVTINFSSVTRNYSRLRIVCSSGTNLNVSLTDFTPAGNNTSSGTTNIDLTTDDKGNAYLYGTWTGSSNLDVTYGSQSLVNKDNITASVANTSYVVDASFATNFPNASTYDQIGSGTPDCPYILLNGTQFNNFATNGDKSKHYKMDKDIDLSEYTDWIPISSIFTGTFDGGNHIITGLTRTTAIVQFGLFNQNSGTIKNLTISKCKISCGDENSNVAVIAYQNNNTGIIENCHVQEGTVQARSGAYGITFANMGKIIACSNSANITATGNSVAAGICNQNMASIIACYNKGILSGAANVLFYDTSVTTNTTVISCYTTNGNINSGSLFGTHNISNCYYLNNSTITDQSGSTVADWQAAIQSMNAAIDTYNETADYKCNYKYELGADGLPTLMATE